MCGCVCVCAVARAFCIPILSLQRWTKHPEAAAMLNTLKLASKIRPRLLLVENVLGWQQAQSADCISAMDYFVQHMEKKLMYKCLVCEVDHGWWSTFTRGRSALQMKIQE